MKKPESICVFGDSAAWGAWDLEKGGWVNRLWLHIGPRDEDYAEIYNLSISGGTTETILERFEKESAMRYGPDALIFQTGGNDASREHGKDTHRVAPEKFEENVREIIKRAKKHTDKIVFLGFKNCDESKTVPVYWIDIDYLNSDLQKYDAIMKKVCQETGVLFCDIKPLNNEDFYDGLHPNAAGHEKIFVQVRDFLTTHGWI